MREPTKSNVALLIGSKEVHGTTATLEALRILLATIPRAVATSVLCYIGSHWPGDSADDWMSSIGPGSSRSALVQRHDGP